MTNGLPKRETVLAFFKAGAAEPCHLAEDGSTILVPAQELSLDLMLENEAFLLNLAQAFCLRHGVVTPGERNQFGRYTCWVAQPGPLGLRGLASFTADNMAEAMFKAIIKFKEAINSGEIALKNLNDNKGEENGQLAQGERQAEVSSDLAPGEGASQELSPAPGGIAGQAPSSSSEGSSS